MLAFGCLAGEQAFHLHPNDHLRLKTKLVGSKFVHVFNFSLFSNDEDHIVGSLRKNAVAFLAGSQRFLGPLAFRDVPA